LMHHVLHHPLRDRTAVKARLDAVEALAGAGVARPFEAARMLLRRAADVERITARIALRSARPRDLTGLQATLQLLPELQASLAGASSPRLTELAQQTAPRPDLADLLARAIRPEPSATVREGGVIADGYDAELDELRAIQNNCGAFLLELETRE